MRPGERAEADPTPAHMTGGALGAVQVAIGGPKGVPSLPEANLTPAVFAVHLLVDPLFAPAQIGSLRLSAACR